MIITELPDITALNDELLESVLICLFTDKYVPNAELNYDIGTNGGWHGDSITLDEAETISLDYSWGSRLWTLQRAKSNEATPEIVKEIIEEALAPLLLLKEINSIDVIVEQITDGISFELVIFKSSGEQVPYTFKNIGG